MRSWILVAAILGCLLIELVHPVLTRARVDAPDPGDVLLDAWNVGSAHEPASLSILDLLQVADEFVTKRESANSLDGSAIRTTRERASGSAFDSTLRRMSPVANLAREGTGPNLPSFQWRSP